MDVPQIIDDLYEGTLDPAAWDRAILAIADAVRASGAILFAFNPRNGAVLRNENHRVDPQALADYARYWTFEDFRRRYFLATPTWQPATEVTMAIPLKGSRLYHEFLLAVDMPHFLPVWVYKSKKKVVALSFQGSQKRGAFESRDLEFVRGILPHFARALEIRDRLEGADVRAANFAKLLDKTTFGVMVLDAQKRIVDANAVAAEILHEGSGLLRGNDGVLSTRHCNGERLNHWMLMAAASRGEAAQALLHIPRDGKLPLSVLGVPLPALQASWMSAEPAWILLVFDPEREVPHDRRMIVSDLGLSEREAEVARLLAVGLPVGQIAARMHVTVHTVRSQLKSAFHKTGCHTQAQLVKRLLLGPGSANARKTRLARHRAIT